MPSESNEAVQKLVQGVLAGNRLLVARAITQVENETSVARPLLQTLYPHTGKAHIVGVTGAPGTGKSTLVTELTRAYRNVGFTVAIVAVDPTSPFTGRPCAYALAERGRRRLCTQHGYPRQSGGIKQNNPGCAHRVGCRWI
jgi:stage III sporulation protein SpoIIIAA